MLTTAYYFLQVILCSALLMGYYWLVLRNKRFHQYNRFYLLAIALLSWMVPLIKIKWGQNIVLNNDLPVIRFLNVVAYNNSQIEETVTHKTFQWDWNVFAGAVYLLVAGVLLVGTVYALFRIYRLLKTHDCRSIGDVYLILTQAKGTPFSFFRYIFWNDEIDISSEAGKQILQHELTHVQQKHSFDKLLMQVVLIAGWFNPFFWLIKNELNSIHEFIADRKAISNGDTATLAQMLLTAAYPRQQYLLTSPFFSPIKRRLQMLTNNTNPRFSYIRKLVVLPLLAIVVVLFAFRNKEKGVHTLSMATVMENVVENGRQLLLVEDFPIAAGKQAYKNLFRTIDPVSFQRTNIIGDRTGVLLYNGLTINLANSVTFNSLVSEQKSRSTETYSSDTIETHIGVNFQAIARDPLNNLAKNKTVYVKITILHGSKNGDKVWEETHQIKTNEEGVYAITIGQGKRISGIVKTDIIGQIDWNDGTYFMNSKIAVAPSIPASWWVPSDNYQEAGTFNMGGMPYQLYNNDVKSRLHDIKSFNLNLMINNGEDVTILPNTTTIASVTVPGVRKGDPIIVTPQEDYQKWSIYSSWVSADDQVKIRFSNSTDKEVKILGSQYKVVVIK